MNPERFILAVHFSPLFLALRFDAGTASDWKFRRALQLSADLCADLELCKSVLELTGYRQAVPPPSWRRVQRSIRTFVIFFKVSPRNVLPLEPPPPPLIWWFDGLVNWSL